jgi:hypothetical protein
LSTNLASLILAAHSAIVGKSGSGKTTTIKGLIEYSLRTDPSDHWCILDPTKSDYWGLTRSRDGKGKGLPFTVLGGPHGHLPLHHEAGAAIAGVVAAGELPLSVIDMAEFPMGGVNRFFCAFADALLKRNRGVLHLVLEEAHEFAPKERSGIDKENMALYFAKKLATQGRSKGLRIIVATQRTQQLHNSLLGSVDTLVVHRLLAPADQKPVLEWVKAALPKDKADAVARDLTKLEKGQAFVINDTGVQPHQFPDIHTYDNTKSPSRGDKDIEVTVPPIDLEKLKSLMGSAVEEAEANDPKKLRARIKELEANLEHSTRTVGAIEQKTHDQHVEHIARLEELANESQQRAAEASSRAELLEAKFADTTKVLTQVQLQLLNLTGNIRENMLPPLERMVELTKGTVAEGAAFAVELEADQKRRRDRAVAQRAQTDQMAAARRDEAPAVRRQTAPVDDGELKPTQIRCLDAFAWYEMLAITEPTDEQLCFRLGYSPTSSTMSVLLSKLRKGGYIQGSTLTPKGRKLATPPKLGSLREFHDQIRNFLGSGGRKVFDYALLRYPRACTEEDICGACGWSTTSSTLSVAVSELRRCGLMEKRSYALTQTVFPKGLR